MMDVMGSIVRGGCHPCPAWGAPDDGFDQSSQGRVGGGQGVRLQSLIEAVNHCRLQDRGCVSAQRCTGVITIPSHLASRYMRLFTTTDLTWQHFAIFEMISKCSIYISCPLFTNPSKRGSTCNCAAPDLWVLF